MNKLKKYLDIKILIGLFVFVSLDIYVQSEFNSLLVYLISLDILIAFSVYHKYFGDSHFDKEKLFKYCLILSIIPIINTLASFYCIISIIRYGLVELIFNDSFDDNPYQVILIDEKID